MDIDSPPVTALKGVGPRLAEKLQRLDLYTVQDVLFHLPYRYQDRTRIVELGGLRPGMEAVVVGTIEVVDVAFRGKRSLLCRISDGTGFLTLRFFHFSAAQQSGLQRGSTVRAYGGVRLTRLGLEMIHPEYTVISEHDTPSAAEDHLTPVYPTTEGVHQLSLRRLVAQALDRHLADIREWLPQDVLAELDFPVLKEALHCVHHPAPDTEVGLLLEGRHPLQQRLAFEELLAYQLSLLRARTTKQQQQAPSLGSPGRLHQQLLEQLPFDLTDAQRRVIDEVRRDLGQECPMQRLVQGDVGSGKTLVAAAVATFAVEAAYQVAIMAPTELLAEQHARNFQQWFEPLGVEVARLSGKQGARSRAAALAAIASGEAAVVVGTHALFQQGVEFAGLGLVVIDEQHRFGVHQRLALREKGNRDGRYPHQLIMTATPIPRTLAQAIYADLNVSVVDELPPSRTPVKTVVIPDSRRAEVVERVLHVGRQGQQVYWVCPLIEESEALELQTATDTETALAEALPQLRVALVHGRMRPAEKERVMAAFMGGEVDLLVATTVIEVGMDVPNASLMIIENAERLGLSQLHQLRGRVGRGTTDSSCVLLYQPPLSELARKRLSAMRETNDGFEIARRDLELRGPGEMLGTRQTGMPRFRIADIMRDQVLLPSVQRTAALLLEKYPDRIGPLVRRWLGQGEKYSDI